MICLTVGRFWIHLMSIMIDFFTVSPKYVPTVGKSNTVILCSSVVSWLRKKPLVLTGQHKIRRVSHVMAEIPPNYKDGQNISVTLSLRGPFCVIDGRGGCSQGRETNKRESFDKGHCGRRLIQIMTALRSRQNKCTRWFRPRRLHSLWCHGHQLLCQRQGAQR